jgi:hypothetical protein
MKSLVFTLFFFITSPTWAIAIDIPPGKWQCMSVDNKERNYGALGKSLKAARHAALIECRRRSEHPKSCRTAQSYCEQGPLTTLENRCIVSDESGRTWNTTGQDACKSALYMCRQWQYLHGSTRSMCSIKHRMRDYDRGTPNDNNDDS